MNYEQLSKLAWTERQIMNAIKANRKITSVVGKSLWPAADMKITCKVYGSKPVTVTSVKRETVKRSRFKKETPTVRSFDSSQLAAMNDAYVAMLAGETARRDRAVLIGEAKR